MKPPETTAAVWVSILGGVAFLLLAWWLVPWNPVPGGPVEPVAPGSIFTPAEIARAEEFSRWARVWGWSALGVSLLVACWLGFTSAGRRLVSLLPGRWWVQVPLAVVAFGLVVRLATLPFAAAGHRHRVDAGLSTQGWGAWLRDLAVGEAVAAVTTGVVLVVLVGAARRWRRVWPAIAAVLVGSFVMLGSYVYPVVVEPLFNDFEPLPAGELRDGILELADREGVDVEQVLVSDASKRTTTLNAYVSGFGPTRRVVVYDNLVDDVERERVLAVVAHELAHAANRDVLVGSVLGAAGAATGVGLLALVLSRRRAGALRDPGSVPTVLALVAVASLLAAPLENGVSRRVETRADVQALAATDEPHAFVGLQRELALRSLADPTPPAWAHWWFGSHPTVLARVALADRQPQAQSALADAAASTSEQVSSNMLPVTPPRA